MHLRLYRFLENHRPNSFVSSAAIAHWTGISPSQVRKLANEAPQTFVSSPTGYKLAKNCSATEIEDSVRVLLSRAEKIMHRARSLQRLSFERNKATRRAMTKLAVS